MPPPPPTKRIVTLERACELANAVYAEAIRRDSPLRYPATPELVLTARAVSTRHGESVRLPSDTLPVVAIAVLIIIGYELPRNLYTVVKRQEYVVAHRYEGALLVTMQLHRVRKGERRPFRHIRINA